MTPNESVIWAEEFEHGYVRVYATGAWTYLGDKGRAADMLAARIAALEKELAELRTYAATAHSHESWESLKAAHEKALIHARNAGLNTADAKILKTAVPPAFLHEHHPDRKEYEAAMSGYSVGVNHVLDTIRAMIKENA